MKNLIFAALVLIGTGLFSSCAKDRCPANGGSVETKSEVKNG